MPTQDFLDEYMPEDGEWEEGVVYVDEDGNEFTVEFVEEGEDANREVAEAEAGAEAGVDVVAEGETEEENPFAYDAVQSATDAANEIYHHSAGTARDLAEAGREMKDTLDDIKSMLDIRDMFKF